MLLSFPVVSPLWLLLLAEPASLLVGWGSQLELGARLVPELLLDSSEDWGQGCRLSSSSRLMLDKL